MSLNTAVPPTDTLVATSKSPLTDTSFLNSVLAVKVPAPVTARVPPREVLPSTDTLPLTPRTPLTDTSSLKVPLPTTVTVELNVPAPVLTSVPPIEVLPATAKAPLTETSSLKIAVPVTVTVPSIRALPTEILPPIEAVSPVNAEPSPKYLAAHTVPATCIPEARLAAPDTPKVPLTCTELVAILNAV